MASAPAPNASISANGSFWVPSRTRPLEPTQIAPEFSTTGSKAAARPPVMGSLTVPRATRLETTTRFTGDPLLISTRELTAIHQYGSQSSFQRNETRFRRCRGGTWPFNAAKLYNNALDPREIACDSSSCPASIIVPPHLLHHRRDAPAIPALRAVRRND